MQAVRVYEDETHHETHDAPGEIQRVRGRTISFRSMQRAHAGKGVAPVVFLPILYDRPKTRGDCLPGGVNAQRPCPFVSCAHHLYLDVLRKGAIKLNFPDVDPESLEKMPSTCALDVADERGATMERVGKTVNMTRERVRQIEEKAKPKMLAAAQAVGLSLEDAAFVGEGRLVEEEAPTEPSVSETRIVEWPTPTTTDLPEGVELDDDPEGARKMCRTVYAAYERACDRQRERARGSIMELGGVPVSPQHMEMVEAIRKKRALGGRGPSPLEIANAVGLEIATDQGKRVAVYQRLEALILAGIVTHSRTDGFGINEEKVAEAETEDPLRYTPRRIRDEIEAEDDDEPATTATTTEHVSLDREETVRADGTRTETTTLVVETKHEEQVMSQQSVKRGERLSQVIEVLQREPKSAAELAEIFGTSPQNMSQALKRLAHRGIAEKIGDGRWRLTKTGKKTTKRSQEDEDPTNGVSLSDDEDPVVIELRSRLGVISEKKGELAAEEERVKRALEALEG